MSLEIAKDRVVLFHYRLREEVGETCGEELENSYAGDPTAYLHGQGNIIPGLEQEMLGKAEGDQFSVTIAPAQAYGPRRPDSVQRVPIKHLSGVKKPRVGQVVSVQTDRGLRQVQVIKVGRFNVDVDTNHPLAGKTLVFDVQIVDVRQATPEELSHGHAHGLGGHHH